MQGLLDVGYYNAGQSCTAATRVLAAPGVHDELVARLAAGAAAMRPAARTRAATTAR